MNTAPLGWRTERDAPGRVKVLEIECPWCGARDQDEFQYGGEAQIVRPTSPEDLSDAQWADYLFNRANTKGPHAEQWCHGAGCRRWFNVVRDTVSYAILAIYRTGDRPPGQNP